MSRTWQEATGRLEEAAEELATSAVEDAFTNDNELQMGTAKDGGIMLQLVSTSWFTDALDGVATPAVTLASVVEGYITTYEDWDTVAAELERLAARVRRYAEENAA